MSQRTRNHIIEDESRNRFKDLIPQYWVCRDKSNDYGIDCEVEIFDERGNTTGKVFWVQLKATDSKNKASIQKVSFPASKIVQFIEYDIPVLIARYSTNEKIFYIKWAKSIELVSNTETCLVRFYENELWSNESAEKIQNYLEKVSFIRQGSLCFPLPVYTYNESLIKSKTPPRIVISNLRNELSFYKSFVENKLTEKNALITISLCEKSIKIDLCNQGRVRLDFNFNIPIDYIILSKVILICIGMCLYQVKQQELCNKLILEGKLFDIVKEQKQILIYLLPSLLQGQYFEKVLKDLIEVTNHDKENNLIQQMTQILLFLERNNHDPSRLKIVEDFLIAQIENAKKTKIEKLIGISYYNIGNYYYSLSKCDLAISNHIKAQKYYKLYLKHDYYFKELGGLFYMNRRYLCASKAYQKALDLGSPIFNTKALYADSLMYAGFYKNARDVLNEYLSETVDKVNENDEWYLKFSCIASLLKAGYPEYQKRDMNKAMNLASEEKYTEALDSDMLCEFAWFNMGVKYFSEKDTINATIAFLMSALLFPSDLESWCNACLCSTSKELNSIFIYHIVRVAYHYNGERFIEQLYNQLKSEDEEFVNTLLDVIDKTISENKIDKTTIRLYLDDGSYDTIII